MPTIHDIINPQGPTADAAVRYRYTSICPTCVVRHINGRPAPRTEKKMVTLTTGWTPCAKHT